MQPNEDEKKKKTKKILKKNSSAYIKQREKANARKRKFLDNMTEEQREVKRAKDREYYQKKKAEKKVKKAADMTERELRTQRKQWKQASKKYRDKKKMLENALSNTPPSSETELVEPPQNSVRRQRGRKTVKKDRAKAYRKIKKQQDIITKMRRKIEALNKKISRKERTEKKKDNVQMTPNSKVHDLIKDIPVPVPPEVRKQLLFGEVLSTQLKTKSATLHKNSKERDMFQRCVSGTGMRKYKLLHMAKTFMPKQKNNKTIQILDKKVREIVLKPDVMKIEINFKALSNLDYNRASIFKTIYNSSSSDDEDLETISLRQKGINTNFKDIVAGSSYDTNSKENIHPNLICPGIFLLVKVPTQKKNVFYRYLATSQTCVEDDGEVKVTFLRSVRNTAKIFQLDPKDVSYVTYEQIIEITPTPSLKVEKNREYYHFKSDIHIFEKC